MSGASEDMNEELSIELEALESYFSDGKAQILVDKQQHPQIGIRLSIILDGLPSPVVVKSGKKEEPFEFLSPVELRISVPEAYPEAVPRFEVSCCWLSIRQISQICQKLDEISQDNPSCPVILQWSTWVQSECANVLCISSPLELKPLDGLDDPSSLDARAGQDCSSGEESLKRMKEHDEAQSRREFCAQLHSCGVCFDDVPGSKATQLAVCKHIFCKECLRTLCAVQIKDGTVQLVKCPEMGCGEPLLPTDIKALVDEAEYERYEQMSLVRVLDSMEDVHWCPRCQAAVIKEPDDQLGMCAACGYSFCVVCCAAWHIGPCQKTDDKTLGRLQKAIAQIGTPTSKADQEKLRKLQGAVDAIKSERAILTSGARKCPRCQTTIEKNGGCNKMTCVKCGAYFCWLCMKPINGYEHFQYGECKGKLFPAEAINEWENGEAGAVMAGVDVAQNANAPQRERARSTECPECGVIKVKQSSLDSNYMNCDCGAEFCFVCLLPCKMAADDNEETYATHFQRAQGKCKEYTTIAEEADGDTYW